MKMMVLQGRKKWSIDKHAGASLNCAKDISQDHVGENEIN